MLFVSCDVTFFEKTHYFQKSSLQREKLSEDRFIDFDFSPPTSTKQESTTSSNSDMPYIEQNLNSVGDAEEQRDIGLLNEVKIKEEPHTRRTKRAEINDSSRF